MDSAFTNMSPKIAQRAALVLTCGLLAASASTICALVAAPAAHAQAGFVRNKPGDLPDSSQFYMSRRQIQVVDDSPIVKFGGGGGASAAGGNGPIPTGGQMALPRAGFQSYTSAAPSITTPLPKVNNGVPPKPTPQEEAAARAKAESLRKSQAKAAAAQAHPKTPPPPEGIKAYNSYKGYNPANTLPTASAASGSSSSSNGQVKGNILHWNKHRRAE
jgi:hypothetical protein